MKRTYYKKSIAIICAAIMAAATFTMAGCGCQVSHNINSSDETSALEEATVATLGETDQAIVDSGLTVDDSGNIVDNSGNKVKVAEDGTVEIKTADGKTVKVDASAVKTANDNKITVDKINAEAAEVQRAARASENSGNSGNNQSSNSGGSSSQSSKPAQSSQASSGGQTSKPSQSSQTSSGQSSKPSQSSQTSSGGQTSKPQQSSQSQSSTVDPHEGKTWHEAEYEYIKHPAVKETVKVIDEPEHQETITTTKKVYVSYICWGCGVVLDGWSSNEKMDHAIEHHNNGEPSGSHSGFIDEEVEETITVPEKSHYEERVVTEEWTEKKIVREAGWY